MITGAMNLLIKPQAENSAWNEKFKYGHQFQAISHSKDNDLVKYVSLIRIDGLCILIQFSL